MTDVIDPIEKAADALIELINSKPQSPRKDEIMDVLRLHHPHRPAGYLVSQGALDMALSDTTQYTFTSHARYLSGNTNPNLPWSLPNDPTNWDGYTSTSEDSAQACDLSEASLEKIISQLENYRELQPPEHPACIMYRDGFHRLRGASYDINRDAYSQSCACGYRSVLQK